MFKKALSLIVALLMIASSLTVGFTAFASETTEPADIITGVKQDFDATEVVFDVNPDDTSKSKINESATGVMDYTSKSFSTDLGGDLGLTNRVPLKSLEAYAVAKISDSEIYTKKVNQYIKDWQPNGGTTKTFEYPTTDGGTITHTYNNYAALSDGIGKFNYSHEPWFYYADKGVTDTSLTKFDTIAADVSPSTISSALGYYLQETVVVDGETRYYPYDDGSHYLYMVLDLGSLHEIDSVVVGKNSFGIGKYQIYASKSLGQIENPMIQDDPLATYEASVDAAKFAPNANDVWKVKDDVKVVARYIIVKVTKVSNGDYSKIGSTYIYDEERDTYYATYSGYFDRLRSAEWSVFGDPVETKDVNYSVDHVTGAETALDSIVTSATLGCVMPNHDGTDKVNPIASNSALIKFTDGAIADANVGDIKFAPPVSGSTYDGKVLVDDHWHGDFVYTLDKNVPIEKIKIVTHSSAALKVGRYALYLSDDRDTLFNEENKIVDYDNTGFFAGTGAQNNDISGRPQQYMNFNVTDKNVTAKFFGFRVYDSNGFYSPISGANSSGTNGNYYLRMMEVNVYGDSDAAYANIEKSVTPANVYFYNTTYASNYPLTESLIYGKEPAEVVYLKNGELHEGSISNFATNADKTATITGDTVPAGALCINSTARWVDADENNGEVWQDENQRYDQITYNLGVVSNIDRFTAYSASAGSTNALGSNRTFYNYRLSFANTLEDIFTDNAVYNTENLYNFNASIELNIKGIKAKYVSLRIITGTHPDFNIANYGSTATSSSYTRIQNIGVYGTPAEVCEEHTWKDVIITEATCQEVGSKYKVCTVCGTETEPEEIPLAHKAVVVPGKDATCSETGLTAGSKCEVCDLVLEEQKEIPTIPHTEKTVNGKAPTCKDTGLTDGVVCSVCGFEIEAQTEIPKTDDHDTELVGYKEATSTTPGYTGDEVCKICGKTIKEGSEIPATPSPFINSIYFDDTMPINCGIKTLSVRFIIPEGQKDIYGVQLKVELPEGFSIKNVTSVNFDAGWEVSFNAETGTIIVESTDLIIPLESVPADGEGRHYLINLELDVAEGIESGKKTTIVTVEDVATGDTYNENTTPSTATFVYDASHTEETVKGYAATCTTKGLTDGVKCSVCGVIIKAQEEIAELGHTEEIVKGYAATCTTKGLTDGVKCSVCGEILTAQEEIKELGHTETAIGEAKDATCTENGITAGVKCSVCGVVLEEQKTIDALGHKMVVEGDKKVCANGCGKQIALYTVTFVGKDDAPIYTAVVEETNPYLTAEDVAAANAAIPYIYGYEVTGWDDEVSVDAVITGSKTINAIYTRKTDKHETGVTYSDGTTEKCDVEFDQRFTVTDNNATAFLVNGQVVGGAGAVTLYGCGELDLVASAEVIPAGVSVAILKTVKEVINGENVLRVFTNIYNPENAVVEESGIIVLPGSVYDGLTDKAYTADSVKELPAGYSLTINSSVNANQMLVTYAGIANNVRRVVRAYAKFGGEYHYNVEGAIADIQF